MQALSLLDFSAGNASSHYAHNAQNKTWIINFEFEPDPAARSFSNILYALYQAQTKGQAWGDEGSGVWGCFSKYQE